MPDFNPLQFRHALADMRYLSGESAWGGHLPFTQVIMPLVRPRVFVELGTHAGDSYCGFCQAVVDQQLLETRCHAVDTWRGDAHTGAYGERVYEQLRSFHDAAYASFSTLHRMTFDQALEQFADRSIDLLHIDGLHTYEAVRHDYEAWRPKLSDRGVVLFHDTAVWDGDFGVWQFWDELKVQFPNFEFPHESGLGVIAVGAAASPALLSFLETANREAHLVRGYFKALGDRYTFATMLMRSARTLYAAHATADQWRISNGRPAAPPLADTDARTLADAVLRDVRELTGQR